MNDVIVLSCSSSLVLEVHSSRVDVCSASFSTILILLSTSGVLCEAALAGTTESALKPA